VIEQDCVTTINGPGDPEGGTKTCEWYPALSFNWVPGAAGVAAAAAFNGQGAAGSNRAWAFAKAFASNFFSAQFYKEELQPGGCLDTFVTASADAANPISPSLAGAGGAGTMAASAAIRYNAAQAYAASRPNVLGGRGLIFPQKSIPYNNILEGGAALNLLEGLGGYIDGALLQGWFAEAQAAYNGTCH
jgi:hypothetical protein